MSIRIVTLGDILAHEYVLCARCDACHHLVDLDTAALILKLGEETGS